MKRVGFFVCLYFVPLALLAEPTCITVATNGVLREFYALSGHIDQASLPTDTRVLVLLGSIGPIFTTSTPVPLLPPSFPFKPGQGGFFRWLSHTNVTACFTNNPSPILPLPLPSGYSLVCCQSNIPATFEDIVGRAPDPGTRIYRLIPGQDPTQIGDASNHIYSFDGGNWSPDVPVANVGEAVLVFQPTTISNVRILDGKPGFDFLTPLFAIATIECSEALGTNTTWTPLTNCIGSGSMANFLDTSDINSFTQRFYRVNLHQ